MRPNDYVLLLYFFFLVVRINGCVRRGRRPLLRGREWFFDVQITPGFYEGAGRRILHRYWMRMLIPIAVEIPLAVALLLTGKLWLLNVLMIAFCVVIVVNHSFSVDLAERRARAFAVPGTEQPAARMASSLTPRRLRDYTNWKVEVLLGASCAFAVAWIVRYYFEAPGHHDQRQLFAAPAFMLYLQGGMLYAKHLIVAWRSPIPQTDASEYIEAREERRRFYLDVCDWGRAVFAAALLFSTLRLGTSPGNLNRLVVTWLSALVVLTIVSSVWIEVRRREVMQPELRRPPVRLPDFLNQSAIARSIVCFQPSAPMLMLKGSHGYSLNLANKFACLGAAYLAGLVALFAALPMPR